MKSSFVRCDDVCFKKFKHHETDYGMLFFLNIKPTQNELIVLKSDKDKYLILDSDYEKDIGMLLDVSLESDESLEFEKVPSNYKVELRND